MAQHQRVLIALHLHKIVSLITFCSLIKKHWIRMKKH